MEVVFKEGLLYLQAVKFGKKTWRKIWMACFKASSSGVGRLEMYTVAENCSSATSDHKKPGRVRSHGRKVVPLSDCLSVTSAPKQSCPAECEAFYLNTTSVTYTLASPQTQDWISALCLLAFQKDPEDADKGAFDRGNCLIMEDNELYSSWESDTALPVVGHHVTVRTTEASQRCNLTGGYLVSPEDDALLLLDPHSCDIIFRWPYKTLRKYGQVEGGFSIEAGRRCDSGAGKFVFLSKQAQHIFDIISQQCTEKTPSPQQPCTTQALFDQSAGHSPITTDQSGFQDLLSPDPDDETLQYYSSLPDSFGQLSVGQAHSGEESEGKDDPDCSSEADYLFYTSEESIYYNLPRAGPVPTRDRFTDDPQSLYSCVEKERLHPSPASTPPLQPSPCPVPKPRRSLQPVMDIGTEEEEEEEEEEEQEEEGIVSTGHITPSEAPASFKHRLAKIISKDLAKFQAAVPPGGAGVTYPQ